MIPRLILQLILISVPFILYGLFRIATREAREQGKAWPYQILFIVGLGISAAFWLLLVFLEDRDRQNCYAPTRYENGQIVGGELIPCPDDRTKVDSGKSAHEAGNRRSNPLEIAPTPTPSETPDSEPTP